MNKKPEFKKRYVLGEGYPWTFGRRLTVKISGTAPVRLKWPLGFAGYDLAKYRLVLERVDGKK